MIWSRMFNVAFPKSALFMRLREFASDVHVLEAMEAVPRELFVPNESRHLSYEDIALPIDHGQSISQPYMVALMTSALQLSKDDLVLELGTGSGYHAAVMSMLCRKIHSVERLPALASAARNLIHSLGYSNVNVHASGEILGLPQEAPFDAIMVTAACAILPEVLVGQMASNGRMIISLGGADIQILTMVTKTIDGYITEDLGLCRFVPLI